MNAWEQGFGSRARQNWARSYFDSLGADDLRFMGYDGAQILGALSSKGEKHWSDPLMIRLSPVYHWLEPYVYLSKTGRTGRSKFARR